MLAYRHAFHAGNHADVLKHVVLVAALRHLAAKEKGFRVVDTHAGAGGYALDGHYAQKKLEYADGIGRLWERNDLPPAVADYVALVRAFNEGGALKQYPGSPALVQALLRPQDEVRCFEMHPTEYKILSSFIGDAAAMADGFMSLKGVLPPPTRRGLVLIDPPYELKTDYVRTLGALRETLERFADAVVIVWLPQLQLLDSRQLPQRLKATADAQAKKGWLHARLTVAHGDARGFGLLGSSVFVANPPHTLAPALKAALPWLAQVLAQDESAWALEKSASA